MKLNTINKILLINLAFIGDVVLSTTVARALRENYPGAQIDFMTIPVAAGISCLNPYINNTIIYDKRGKHRRIWELSRLIWRLRSQKYELAVSTNFAPRGAILAKLAGIPYRVGYKAQHGEWFLTHVANPSREIVQHEAQNQLNVLKPLGISTQDTSLTIRMNQQDEDNVSHLIDHITKPKIVICPYGSYDRKSWADAGYVSIIKTLSLHAQCFLIGGKRESERLQKINMLTGNKAQVFDGTLSLGELAVLLARSNLLISVDTAPLHIGQAVHIPTLALFGPTDPAIWGPRGSNCYTFYRPTKCSPCWGRGECAAHVCMGEIKDDEVITRALQLLELSRVMGR